MEDDTLLRVDRLFAGYPRGGDVLHGISLQMRPGEVLAIAGHNGAGKTTLLRTLAGLRPATSGRMRIGDHDVTRWPTHRRARVGIGLVPQGRRLFPSITVAEHLALSYRASRSDTPKWTKSRVCELFPQLRDRLNHSGGKLSGGEQQMLAMARALLTQPRLLLLDEPPEGLAPAGCQQVADTITTLAAEGIAVLVTVPRPGLATAVADRIHVLTTGRLGAHLDGPDMRADDSSLWDALAVKG